MSSKKFLGHPQGLFLLFATEMWERFSYYGMRAVLALYFTKALLFDKAFASNFYGGYTSLAYLSPVIGGFIADKYWGNRRSILVGGTCMALGQLCLFISGTYYDQPIGRWLLFAGLGVMILGNGFFKPNISSMVGTLYSPADRRKDAAYTIFYMGINLGSFIGQTICGLVGDTGNPADFRWAFLACSIAMALGTVIFLIGQDKYLNSWEGKPLGHTPEGSTQVKSIYFLLPVIGIIGIAMLFIDVTIYPILLFIPLMIFGGSLFYVLSDKTLTSLDRGRVIVIYVVSLFVVVFWAAFEQAGASLTFFADEQVNRTIFGWTIPASLFQNFNPFFVVTCAPLMALLWTWLGNKGIEPASPYKMAIGLGLLSLGYALMLPVLKDITPGVKVSAGFLAGLYLLHSLGELCLSPIGLSLVNQLAPRQHGSLLMAVWFMANMAANKFAGTLSAFYPAGEGEFRKAAEAGIDLPAILSQSIKPTVAQLAQLKEMGLPLAFPSLFGYQITTLYDFFLMFVVIAGVAAVLLFILSRRLVKMM